MLAVGIVVPAAAGFAEVFQPPQQRLAQALGHALAADGAPAAGQATEVHEVKVVAFAVREEELFDGGHIRLG